MCRCHRLPGAIGACLVVSHIHCRRRCLPGASVALPSHAVRFHTRPIQLLETIAALPVRLVWCQTLGRSVRLSETIGALPSRFGKRQTQCRSRRLCRLTSSRSGRVNKFQYRGQGQAWSSVTRSSATVMSLRFSMALVGVLDGFRAIIGANARARNPRHNDTGQCVATASVSSVCSRRSPSTPWDEKMSDQFCASRGRLRRVNWRAAEDLSGARGRSAALTREGSRERAVNTGPLPPWDQRVLSSQCGEPVPPWPEPNTSKRQISGAVPWPEAPASCTYKDSPPLPWSAQDTSSDKATDPKLPGRLDEFAVTMRRQALRAFLEETCGSVSSAFERLIESVPRTRSSQRSGLASERWRHALTPAEFRTSMTALGYGARSVSWNALFQCVDVDGDGRVSLQDLLNALERDPPSRISAPPVPW